MTHTLWDEVPRAELHLETNLKLAHANLQECTSLQAQVRAGREIIKTDLRELRRNVKRFTLCRSEQCERVIGAGDYNLLCMLIGPVDDLRRAMRGNSFTSQLSTLAYARHALETDDVAAVQNVITNPQLQGFATLVRAQLQEELDEVEKILRSPYLRSSIMEEVLQAQAWARPMKNMYVKNKSYSADAPQKIIREKVEPNPVREHDREMLLVILPRGGRYGYSAGTYLADILTEPTTTRNKMVVVPRGVLNYLQGKQDGEYSHKAWDSAQRWQYVSAPPELTQGMKDIILGLYKPEDPGVIGDLAQVVEAARLIMAQE